MGDWSFLWNLIVEGPDVLKLFSHISVNTFARFDIGQGKHIICCNDNGKVIVEGILMRLDDQRFAVQSSPAFWAGYWN
jgi:vanillate/3-O-methylgallate O-demethylase